VSYVLSHKRKISPATRQQVERSIAILGYQPNARARALASKRTNALALVAPLRADNNVPVIMQFVASVAVAARARDHDLLLVTEEEGEAGVRRISQTALVDGVIVMDVETDDHRLSMLRSFGLPCVLIGRPDEPGGLSCVDLDFYQAATLCVEHLADLGHRELCMLGSGPAVYERRSSFAMAFSAGFEAAVSRRGIAGWRYPTEPGYEQISGLVERVLREHPQTTAFVVHNEAVLPAVLSALRRHGRRVPEDVSVVAICPEEMALSQSVELTGVAVPAERIGRAAVDMVLGLLEGSESAETRLIAPQLAIRASTAPPP
jgi:DNA-binding LacI/PurR family transcriptional regulator